MFPERERKLGDKRVGERGAGRGGRINEKDVMYSKPKLRWWRSDGDENDSMRRFWGVKRRRF